jgi:hypothetical protein
MIAIRTVENRLIADALFGLGLALEESWMVEWIKV